MAEDDDLLEDLILVRWQPEAAQAQIPAGQMPGDLLIDAGMWHDIDQHAIRHEARGGIDQEGLFHPRAAAGDVFAVVRRVEEHE